MRSILVIVSLFLLVLLPMFGRGTNIIPLALSLLGFFAGMDSFLLLFTRLLALSVSRRGTDSIIRIVLGVVAAVAVLGALLIQAGFGAETMIGSEETSSWYSLKWLPYGFTLGVGLMSVLARRRGIESER